MLVDQREPADKGDEPRNSGHHEHLSRETPRSRDVLSRCHGQTSQLSAAATESNEDWHEARCRVMSHILAERLMPRGETA